jgi:hypothetical protein
LRQALIRRSGPPHWRLVGLVPLFLLLGTVVVRVAGLGLGEETVRIGLEQKGVCDISKCGPHRWGIARDLLRSMVLGLRGALCES